MTNTNEIGTTEQAEQDSRIIHVPMNKLKKSPNNARKVAGVAAFLSDPRQPIESTLRAMMTTPHLGEAGVHPVVASAARELLNKSAYERSGVLSTAMSFLGLYRDSVVAEVTSRCDWRIADLVEGALPTTLYLVVPPSDISRTRPLIRLMLNQIGRRLTEDLKPAAARSSASGCPTHRRRLKWSAPRCAARVVIAMTPSSKRWAGASRKVRRYGRRLARIWKLDYRRLLLGAIR